MLWWKKNSANFKDNAFKVFVAESFDGTWVILMLAGAITGRVYEVLLAGVLGLGVIQAFAAQLGASLHGKLPDPEKVAKVTGTIFIGLGSLFLARAFGVIELSPRAAIEAIQGYNTLPFILALAVIVGGFEMFDKTAAVSVHSASTTGDRFVTWSSAMVGLIAANALGVLLLGNLIAAVISPANIELISGGVFVLIGAYLIIGKETTFGWIGIEFSED